MADRKACANDLPTTASASPLDNLNRTLESLEERLSRINTGGASPARTQTTGAVPSVAGEEIRPTGPARPSLSEVVSQIAERQRSLDAGSSQEDDESKTHGAEGQSYRQQGATGVARQLERLRTELQKDAERPFRQRLDGMRTTFDDLRRMIAERASPDLIDAEIARVDEDLVRMGRSGSDAATVRTLRIELQEMRDLVRQMAKGRVPHPAGDVVPGDGEGRRHRQLKDELEQFRRSIGSLASEEHLRSVERRLDAFEASFADASEPLDEAAVSLMLKSEMAALREKLETVASQSSERAIEERWQGLEERFASREMEEKIEAMAARMAQLETAIEKLPETLSIAPLEQRVQALAVGIEALAKYQQDEAEADHFAQLEERLDEISRAIVAAASRPPQIDMSPVERIEARLQNLTSRVDDMAVDADTTIIEERITELSERIETLSNDPKAQELSDRIERFSAHLETLSSVGLRSAEDEAAIEARLQALVERVDEAFSHRVDDDLVRSLEAQVTRLTELVGEEGREFAMGDTELDERFAEIERRLDENRDAIAHSARAAADEAIRQMLESGDFRQSEHVARLSEDLKALEALSRESGNQSQEFFQAVHTTLTQLVERIGQIEIDLSRGGASDGDVATVALAADERGTQKETERTGNFFARAFSRKGRTEEISGKGPAAIAAVPGMPLPTVVADEAGDSDRENEEALSADETDDIFDSQEAHRPLAVGSGAPNISTLLARVRAQQAEKNSVEHDDGKADFIAAARRAAMAAAAEVDNLGEPDRFDETGRSRVADAVSRRKKPILMAIGAVLLALMALPVAKVITAPDASSDNGETAKLAPPEKGNVPAAEETAVADLPAPITLITPKEPEAEAVTVAEEEPLPAPSLMSQTATTPTAFEPRVPENVGPVAKASEASLRTPAGSAGDIRPADVAAAGAAAEATKVSDIPAVPEGIGPAPLVTAAKGGDPKALFEIGLRLMEGKSVSPDPENAARFFANAAERGYAPAQYSLGTLYEKGNGLPRDTVLARDWYVKAADQGNVRAMHNLAVLYATGVDGQSNPKLAASWFERAADYGMTDSQYNLGILYARGAGVDQDLSRSYKWFSVVAQAGDKDAAAKRDEIAKSLDPAQLKTASAAADAFEPRERNELANTVDIPPQWTEAVSATAGTAAPADPIVTSAIDMKKAVRNIQSILITLGYNPGTPDGIAGSQTTAAIRSFQKEAGLDATGRIDEPLIRALLARRDS